MFFFEKIYFKIFIILYDNEYTLLIDIYFHEFSQPSLTSSAYAPNIWDTLSDILESVYASL